MRDLGCGTDLEPVLPSSSRCDGVAVAKLAIVVQDVRLLEGSFGVLSITQLNLVLPQGVSVGEDLFAVSAFLDGVAVAGLTGWSETHTGGARVSCG